MALLACFSSYSEVIHINTSQEVFLLWSCTFSKQHSWSIYIDTCKMLWKEIVGYWEDECSWVHAFI